MQLTRLELYQRVSCAPLSKVAPDFGISGTALAAICQRFQIPYPGSGYWTRKSLGFPVELPPLPEGIDEVIEILPAVPRQRRQGPPRQDPIRKKETVKPFGKRRHPLLLSVEEHLRKTRAVKNGEFLRPYKRILPDIISSEAALLRALTIANDVYLALEHQGYELRIATATEGLHRFRIEERETERKERKYGRYNSGSIWGPDRPTIFYVGAVPIGIAITEMTERVTIQYLNGEYYRADSKIVRSAKPWQLTHSWTHLQDMPCGRFRVIAYSPKSAIDWSVSWQETAEASLPIMISKIVETLQGAESTVHRLMIAADEASRKRKQEQEEELERYKRREDAKKVATALLESQKQLAEVIEKWSKAMAVEQFFTEAEGRLAFVEEERRHHLEQRLTLARKMMGTVDPLDFLGDWRAPEERYRPQFGEPEGH